MAIIVLIYKNEIIDIINQHGLGSLTYGVDQSTVNSIVIRNFDNIPFMRDIANIKENGEGYSNFVCGGLCIAGIVSAVITVVGGSIAMAHKSKKARETRNELRQAELEGRWLTREEQNRLKLYYQDEYELKFLEAQNAYMENQEKINVENQAVRQQSMTLLVLAGVAIVGLAAFVLRK